MKLIEFTNKGLYVTPADTFIDPVKKVKRAIITHGHSDHCRSGNLHYICSEPAVPVIKYRMGTSVRITGVPFGKSFRINNVKFSFHPAGHIIGSSQIRVEYRGEVWVVSGDYKLQNDGLCTPFEPVRCHTFITESTFGLPKFEWKSQEVVVTDINRWWTKNRENSKVSILKVYALGKAQRILYSLGNEMGRVFTHGAIENINEVLRKQGFSLPATTRIASIKNRQIYDGAMILAPPSSTGESWLERFTPYEVGVVSGWVGHRGLIGGQTMKGFAISDHADWKGLNTAVTATGAENVFVMHGYKEAYAKYLVSMGINAQAIPSFPDKKLT